MPPADLSSHLEQLSARLEELERRVSSLEHSRPAPAPEWESPASSAILHPRLTEAAAARPQASGFSIAGQAVLGIAGAFLLRTIADAGFLPSRVVVAISILYACAWLARAARMGKAARLANHVYSLTAAVILSSMLWEVTTRFRMLEPAVVAAVLAAFALLALVLAWRSDVAAVLWVGMLTGILTGLVLMSATRVLLPFVWAIVAIAVCSEIAAGRGRWQGVRPVGAVAADVAALIVLVILGNAAEIPSEYQPVPAASLVAVVAAMFVIYAVTPAIRARLSPPRMPTLVALQFAVVTFLAGWGILRVTAGAGQGPLGACCLICGLACYLAAFTPFSGHTLRPNFNFFAGWAVAFVLLGSFLAISNPLRAVALDLAALAATALGVRMRSSALAWHGALYLGGASWASGLLGYGGGALAGAFSGAPTAQTLACASACLLCALMALRFPGDSGAVRVLRMLPVIFAIYAAMAFAVALLAGIVTKAQPSLPLLAVIRTAVTCAAALLLASAGAKFLRRELAWLAYAAIALGSLKLLVEDLRVGTSRTLAASLVIYGGVLILMPRLVRAGRRQE